MKNVSVEVQYRDNDTNNAMALESALRKFRKELDSENVLNEYRSRQYFEKPSKKNHRKKVAAKHKAKIDKLKAEKASFSQKKSKRW